MLSEPSLRERTHLYWGDERFVPHDDAASNYAAARATLIEPAGIEESNVHPIPTGPAGSDECARAYEEVFPERPDVCILGIGPDGHTASLFPGSPALDETGRRFVTVKGPAEPRLRITATPTTILSARRIMVLVSGDSRAEALTRVFRSRGEARETPARIAAGGTWLVDRAAAERMLRAGAEVETEIVVETCC
jgi:6-phosphogluconolactonase